MLVVSYLALQACILFSSVSDKSDALLFLPCSHNKCRCSCNCLRGMSVPKCLFFPRIWGACGRTSAEISSPEVPLWADFAFLKNGGFQNRGWFWRMFPCTKKQGYIRMFPCTKNRDEGTPDVASHSPKTALLRNRPFIYFRNLGAHKGVMQQHVS